MTWAEFEESSFEIPLYIEMGKADSRVWSPGQCYEGQHGYDFALFSEDPILWEILWNRRRHLNGIALRDLHPNLPGYLPTFQLNVFLQAKRPEKISRVKREIRAKGCGTPAYRFETRAGQQGILENLYEELNNDAWVGYCSPRFSTYDELEQHTLNRTVLSNTSFVSAETMKGHHHWWYTDGGSDGIAASEPESISGKQTPLAWLEAQERPLARSSRQFSNQRESLLSLEKACLTAVELTSDQRHARFIGALLNEQRKEHEALYSEAFGSDWQSISRDQLGFYPQSAIALSTVRAFCRLFHLRWYSRD